MTRDQHRPLRERPERRLDRQQTGRRRQPRISHGNDPIDGDSRPDLRPIKRLHKGLWQRPTRCLDDDVFGRLGPIKERFHRWQKIINHGAANTAIGQFHHFRLRNPQCHSR